MSSLKLTQTQRDPSTLTHSPGRGRRQHTPIALNSEGCIAVCVEYVQLASNGGYAKLLFV